MVNTQLTTQVPFTPTRRVIVYQTWQANDPLVHYMAGGPRGFDQNKQRYLSESRGGKNCAASQVIPVALVC